MKRLVLLLVVAAFAASPAAAASKHKKSEQTAEAKQAAEAAKQHDNTRRALRDALPLVLPSWSLPVFFGMHLDEKMKSETKNEKKKEAKVHRPSSSSPASNR